MSLVVIVLITFGVLIVLQGIALFVALFLFGIDLDSVVKLMSGDTNIPNGRMALYFIQGVGSGIGFLVAAFIVAKGIDHADLGWKRQLQRLSSSKLFLTLLITLGGMFFNALLVYLNAQLELPGFLSELEAWMKEMEDQLMEMTMFLTDFQSVSGAVGWPSGDWCFGRLGRGSVL